MMGNHYKKKAGSVPQFRSLISHDDKSGIALFILLSVLFIGCKTPVIDSSWRTAEILIDGNPAEWTEHLCYPEGGNLGIGVLNDDRYLYLCMSSEDPPTTHQIMARGLVVSFRAGKNKNRFLGIRFPLGMMRSGQPPMMNRHMVHEFLNEQFDAALLGMEILGPGKKDSLIIRTAVSESYGITARIMPSYENLSYELKIPLNQDSLGRFSIGAGSDSLIRVKLEIQQPDFDKMLNRERGPPPGMDGGGRGGMAPGGRGPGVGGGMSHQGGGHSGMGRGSPPGMAEPFELEFSIKLSKKSSQGN